MVWNDMQWYSYSLPFLLMQTFWMDTHWMDPYWWDTCWRYVLVGYVLVGYVCDSCWCTPFEWIRIAWIRIGGIRVERICIGGIRIGGIRIAKPADANVLNGYALHGYVLVGYVLNGYVLVGYVLVGYVLNGYVWDMCGVMDMCGICVVWDMCGICVVWDTPTIFWRTLRRNVFREKVAAALAACTNGTASAQRSRSSNMGDRGASRSPCSQWWKGKKTLDGLSSLPLFSVLKLQGPGLRANAFATWGECCVTRQIMKVFWHRLMINE